MHTNIAPKISPDPRFDVLSVRAQFPTLAQTIKGKPLVYLDNGATAQKPQRVIDTLRRYYEQDNANVHRGVHALSERATVAYENAREVVREFINAPSTEEIIFTSGTTDGINLVAQAFARSILKPGDNLIITGMEHHSNIVPWQLVRDQTGVELRVIPVLDDGSLDQQAYANMLDTRTRLVAFTHISNVLGSINPVTQMTAAAKQVGAATLIDGAQSIVHLEVDVQAIGCDFYAFSAHKLFGPTGTGVLYGRKQVLESMPPYQGGGDMIRSVAFDRSTWNDLPYKFEAGTPNIAGVIGMAEGIRFVRSLDPDAVSTHEQALLDYATDKLTAVPRLRIIGTASKKSAIVSFVMDDVHAHDVGTLLDQAGVAIRTGHHCAMPLMERFDIPATARISLALYNTCEDIDVLYGGLQKIRQLFTH